MGQNLDNILEVLAEFTGYIKHFNQHLTSKYQLNDTPFKFRGQAFPKKGVEEIDAFTVRYQFHGLGCTLDWAGREISFGVDVSSVHDITITSYEIVRFIQTDPLFRESIYINYTYDQMHSVLELLELKGVLMTRKPKDLGSFHINEAWYDAFKSGKGFDGANKDETDWV